MSYLGASLPTSGLRFGGGFFVRLGGLGELQHSLFFDPGLHRRALGSRKLANRNVGREPRAGLHSDLDALLAHQAHRKRRIARY